MTMPAPGWYPDQYDQRFSRWWDGRSWTQHLQPNPAVPQVQQSRPAGGEPLLTEPVIVVNKQYLASGGVFGSFASVMVDERGTRIGALGKVDLDEEAQHGRIFSGSSKEGLGLTEHFQLHDAHGQLVVHIARAIRVKTAARPLFELSLADGTPIGFTQSEKLFGRTITWGFTTPQGARIGGFTSKSMAGPFVVTDQHGTRLAEFARSGDRLNTEGYVLRRPQPVPPPLGWFVLVALMTFDIAAFGNLRE
jgi:hypothetical protein